MSKFLAIDTSSRHLNVLAVNEEKVVQNFLPDCALNHSVLLMGEIDKALTKACLAPKDCDFFAAVTGPGSFTGIRIGIATAKGFAAATDKPLLAVTVFEVIAYTVNVPAFLTVIDAAHGHVYAQKWNGRKAEEPKYITNEEAETCGLPLFGYEALTLKNYTAIDVQAALLPAVCALQSKAGSTMTALYVRKSQAEEGRK